MDLDSFRREFDAWLEDHLVDLAPDPSAHGLDHHMAQLSRVKRAMFDAGWARYGWPERVGGLGGPAIVRAYLGEVLTYRGIVEPGGWSMTEVLAPTVIDFAPSDLAAQMVPRLLRGDEIWCQGFSEPGTGSNLASLTCRATRTERGWRVDGQKVWTSYAQFAARCVLLTRTGPPGSAHRGITALFVDMDTPGITVRPLQTQHGEADFSEVFFDGVEVPADRLLGDVDGGWAVAMDLLPYERSTSLWHRCAYLQRAMESLIGDADAEALDPFDVGDSTLSLLAIRARSRATQYRMSAGDKLGPETSVDKVLLATAEQAVFDTALEGLSTSMVAADGPGPDRWRAGYLYSRAATIYGGSAEIQRNILARRVIGLGAEP